MTSAIAVYLHPGEVYASASACEITTILGSCVSVCLSEQGSQIGGANHFLLSGQRAGETGSTRYAPGAIEELIRLLQSLGAKRSRLRAKLFGGANVLHAFQDGVHHIGAANVETARVLLAKHNIRVFAEDVGGIRGRKLVFHSHDGAASVRRLGV
jgi:chemotaxis protein CheD